MRDMIISRECSSLQKEIGLLERKIINMECEIHDNNCKNHPLLE